MLVITNPIFTILPFHFTVNVYFLFFLIKFLTEGHGDRYSGTLNAVVRFMPSSVNSASACAFKSASMQILIFVVFPVRTILCTKNLFKEVTCFVKVFQLKMMMPM